MTNPQLQSLDITNFRSIRGHIHAPLDAKVVLVHGENGAGKTSLLSAIELALTGRIQALQRADADYQRQILHRSAETGNISVQTIGLNLHSLYRTEFALDGVVSEQLLTKEARSFFNERAYLPQTLLSQLIQIYQESGSDIGSPLAQFVGELLGLERLDALEAGLQPFIDKRNVRKVVDGWSEAESEQKRLNLLLKNQQQLRESVQAKIDEKVVALQSVISGLEIEFNVEDNLLPDVQQLLAAANDEEEYSNLMDQRRRLSSLQRGFSSNNNVETSIDVQSVERQLNEAITAFSLWENATKTQIASLRAHLVELLPNWSPPSDEIDFVPEALLRMGKEKDSLLDQVGKYRQLIVRSEAAQDELKTALDQLSIIDKELTLLPTSTSNLASLLAELSSHIIDEVCPVCDRDFTEVEQGALPEHIHNKVRTLSTSAERLLKLGSSRGEQQRIVERLQREIEQIKSHNIDSTELSKTDRRVSVLDIGIQFFGEAADYLARGAELRSAEVSARRLSANSQSQSTAILAARQMFDEFAITVGEAQLSETESVLDAGYRLGAAFDTKTEQLNHRVVLKRSGLELINSIEEAKKQFKKIIETNEVYQAEKNLIDEALAKAQILREGGVAIRNAVESVRSDIIRKEFNERLNLVWRELFVRLAPQEPFVPAFQIPTGSTKQLQPKLITKHRDGGTGGGTPGAMLSAGNLNTAALTLFTALHLSVPAELPWLILDDPVQSMDDVHIAHFAALLRTLSKEHGRQVIIAVHDRQLFEYLKLELSPAYLGDSLLTLELSRSGGRDTVCLSERLRYREEKTLRAVA